MAFSGMTVTQVQQLARGLSGQVGQLESLRSRIDAVVNEAMRAWDGPDIYRFSNQWWGQRRPQLQNAINRMASMVVTLDRQAADQSSTSGNLSFNPHPAVLLRPPADSGAVIGSLPMMPVLQVSMVKLRWELAKLKAMIGSRHTLDRPLHAQPAVMNKGEATGSSAPMSGTFLGSQPSAAGAPMWGNMADVHRVDASPSERVQRIISVLEQRELSNQLEAAVPLHELFDEQPLFQVWAGRQQFGSASHALTSMSGAIAKFAMLRPLVAFAK
ncbi:MAG: hypothetical protein LBV30_05740 [Propionibacteriaceae bacterium]|jgi:uncharacterized protein YukE|nr:hypothetical protein [Propionibacteriaceae bacterium]